ncbi:MAG: Mth938-like domain-containing protein [Alphaproteobacteria bacterium]|nr:Mth938-like domain-containing protein [Alphaproteobacteria bacterium]
MEITPLIPAGRQVIERYAAIGFRVSGIIYRGPVLIFPDRTIAWPAPAWTPDALLPVVEHGETELLLLGLGLRMSPIPVSLRTVMKAHGIALEPMDTGAACRTYNMLLAEDRRVAAALLPPA